MLHFWGTCSFSFGGVIYLGSPFFPLLKQKSVSLPTVRCQVKHLRAAVEAALKDYLGDEAVTFHQLGMGRIRHDSGYD